MRFLFVYPNHLLYKVTILSLSSLNKFSVTIITTLGWVLWITCIALISWLVYVNDVRGTIPYGQYVFFVFTILAGIALFPSIRRVASVDLLKPFLLILTMLFVYVFLSGMFGLSEIQGPRLASILLLTVLPFVMLGVIVGGVKLYYLVIPLFFLALISAIGAAVLQWSGPLDLGGVRISNYLHGGKRWSFLFEEANGLAGVIAVGVTTLLYLAWVVERKVYGFLLVSLVMPFMLFVFWMTNSRASLGWLFWTFLVFGSIAMVMLYSEHQNRKTKYLWWGAGISSIVAILIALPVITDAMSEYLRLDQKDISSGRLKIWGIYWQQFLENPLLGIGFGATSTFLAVESVRSPLNVYVGMLGETGLAGVLPLLILWAGGVFYSARAVVRAWNVDTDSMAVGLWCLAMLGGMAIQQNGEWEIMRVSFINYVFFFTLTVAWVHCSRVSKPVEAA